MTNQPSSGLDKVKSILAVSSCKGGVGKSTVAVNLAFSLAAQGARVGIFDADIYGPSLPTLVTASTEPLQVNEANQLIPKQMGDVKLQSFAYTQDDDQARPAVMRGAMVTQVVNQLLTQTAWGDLDYLVIDMPPGTGDIPLTLAQVVPITGSIIVTTPQKLAMVDVIKGIQMFDNLKIPTIGVVQNMAYFVCDECDKKHFLFGSGPSEQFWVEYGFEKSLHLPLLPQIAQQSDRGIPFVLRGEGPVHEAFKDLATYAAKQLKQLKETGQPPKIDFVPEQGLVCYDPNGQVTVLNPKQVRLACRCAVCVDEFTGEIKVKPDNIPDDIRPVAIKPVGHYAVGINWSDGHSALMPYSALKSTTTPKTPEPQNA